MCCSPPLGRGFKSSLCHRWIQEEFRNGLDLSLKKLLYYVIYYKHTLCWLSVIFLESYNVFHCMSFLLKYSKHPLHVPYSIFSSFVNFFVFHIVVTIHLHKNGVIKVYLITKVVTMSVFSFFFFHYERHIISLSGQNIIDPRGITTNIYVIVGFFAPKNV